MNGRGARRKRDATEQLLWEKKRAGGRGKKQLLMSNRDFAEHFNFRSRKNQGGGKYKGGGGGANAFRQAKKRKNFFPKTEKRRIKEVRSFFRFTSCSKKKKSNQIRTGHGVKKEKKEKIFTKIRENDLSPILRIER